MQVPAPPQANISKNFLMDECTRVCLLLTCKKCTAKIAQSIIWSILQSLLQPEQAPQGKLPSQAIAEIIIICDKVENCTLSLQGGEMSCSGESKHVLHIQELFVSLQCTQAASPHHPTAPEGLKPQRVTRTALLQ